MSPLRNPVVSGVYDPNTTKARINPNTPTIEQRRLELQQQQNSMPNNAKKAAPGSVRSSNNRVKAQRTGGRPGSVATRSTQTLRRTPVSTISTAPVSFGNTIRGTDTVVRATKNGILVSGRDFMFSPIGSGSITTWTMVGGVPLSPSAFADSTLRQYVQRYNKFRFLGFTVHYITSSPTSANGDVMFYYGKNRESPFVNQTSTNLLPFVISDPNTILGPQWQNMSASFQPSATWKSCDYGIEGTPKDYADGELFLLSRTSTLDSPGYVMFDYDIEFGEPSIQPRLLTLPITRQIYSQFSLQTASGATTINTPWVLTNGGNGISGTPSATPPGIQTGDIYKVIFDITNSTLGASSGAITTSLLSNGGSGATIPFVMSDGCIAYAVYNSSQGYYFYPNAIAAYANDRIFWASSTVASGLNITLQVWMSYVGSVDANISNKPNF